MLLHLIAIFQRFISTTYINFLFEKLFFFSNEEFFYRSIFNFHKELSNLSFMFLKVSFYIYALIETMVFKLHEMKSLKLQMSLKFYFKN
jgi:hypothetical protein